MGYASRLAVVLAVLFAGNHQKFEVPNDPVAKATIDGTVVGGFTANMKEREDVETSLMESVKKKDFANAMWYQVQPDATIRAFAGMRGGKAGQKATTGDDPIKAEKFAAGFTGDEDAPCHHATFRLEVINLSEISFLLRGKSRFRDHKVVVEALIEASMSTDGCDRTDPAYAPPVERRKIVIEAIVQRPGAKLIKTVSVKINDKVEPGASFKLEEPENDSEHGEEFISFTDELLAKMNIPLTVRADKGFVKSAKLLLKTQLKVTVFNHDTSNPKDVVTCSWRIAVNEARVIDQEEAESAGTNPLPPIFPK